MKFKNKILIIIIFTILAIPILYFLSDTRSEAVKRVSYIYEIPISKNTKRIKEIYREPSFLGDGVNAVLLEIAKEDRNNFKKDISKIKSLKVIDNSREYSIIEGEIKYIKEKKDFDIGDIKNYEIYYKEKSDNKKLRWGNYYGLLYDENSGYLVFVDYDS